MPRRTRSAGLAAFGLAGPVFSSTTIALSKAPVGCTKAEDFITRFRSSIYCWCDDWMTFILYSKKQINAIVHNTKNRENFLRTPSAIVTKQVGKNRG